MKKWIKDLNRGSIKERVEEKIKPSKNEKRKGSQIRSIQIIKDYCVPQEGKKSGLDYLGNPPHQITGDENQG